MHDGQWACSKRALCCSAFVVLIVAGSATLSTTCTTRGCTRQNGELRDSGKGKGKGKRDSDKTPRSPIAQGRKSRAALSTYATLQRAGVVLEEKLGAQVHAHATQGSNPRP